MIISQETLSEVRANHSHETVVLSSGVFDLLHPGHLQHLQLARKLGRRLVVGLWSNECTAFRKGPNRPVNDIEHRLHAVDAIPGVDYVFEVPDVGRPGDAITPSLELLEPDVYFVSTNFLGGRQSLQYQNGHNTTVIVDPTYVDKIHSTTDILNRLAEVEQRV